MLAFNIGQGARLAFNDACHQGMGGAQVYASRPLAQVGGNCLARLGDLQERH